MDEDVREKFCFFTGDSERKRTQKIILLLRSHYFIVIAIVGLLSVAIWMNG